MKIYEVGGCVRDKLLGRTAVDIDYVVVGATPAEMIDAGYKKVGSDFPVFLHPDTRDEYALARTERKSGKGYSGFTVDASPEITLEEDLRRRDLTINAMARDTQTGEIIDPFNGRQDLKDGVLRHTSDAFAEDPVRVLRVARFAARYDFSIHPTTTDLMKQLVRSGEMATLTPERIWNEVNRALGELYADQFFETLDDVGAVPTLFPEVMSDEERQFLTCPMWNTHTIRIASKYPGRFSREQMFAMLMADIGAPQLWPIFERLRIPNSCRRMYSKVNHIVNTYGSGRCEYAHVIRNLDELGAYRDPSAFIEACTAVELVCASFSRELDSLLVLLDAFTTTKEITFATLDIPEKEQLTGPERGAAIYKARCARVEID
jgi:tRNA nucleotidyltransferase (CCA-adding enzyme)